MKKLLVMAVSYMLTACAGHQVLEQDYSSKCEQLALSIMNHTHKASVLGSKGKNTEALVYNINLLVYGYNNNTRCTQYTGYLSQVDVVKPETNL